MLNYHIYDVIRSTCIYENEPYSFIKKKKTWLLYLNHDNHKLTKALQH